MFSVTIEIGRRYVKRNEMMTLKKKKLKQPKEVTLSIKLRNNNKQRFQNLSAALLWVGILLSIQFLDDLEAVA